MNLGGKLGDTDVKLDVQPEEVGAADTLQFPSVTASQQDTKSGVTDWLIYLSLMIGLIALVLGMMSLRNKTK